MPKNLIEFSALKMDLGVNLQSSLNLGAGELSEARSVRFERGGGVFTGPGYREVSDTGTATSVDGMLGATIFKALWSKSGTKIYYMPDPDTGTKYDSGLTATTATKTWFQQQGNGDVHVFNQQDTPTRIAIARNTVALTSASTEITVGADYIDKFAASGNVRINDDVIAYGAKNATQLTSVTGIQPAGHAVNQMVIQTTNPSTWTEEKGTFSFELDSRMVIGGQINKENVLKASAPEDLNNPAFFYDFDANGTVARVFPHSLTGGIAGLGRAFVFGERECQQILGFDTTTGSFLTSQISNQHGAYNPRCVVDMDGIVCFLGNKRLMPIVLKLSADASVPSLDEKFDHRLRPWLDDLDDIADQDDAFLSYDSTNKILKVGARRGGALEVRSIDIQLNAPCGIESRPGWAWAMFDGKMYWGGTTGKIYRDDFGRSNGGISVYHNWKTGRMSESKGKNIQLYNLEYSGYMSSACRHKLRVYIDGSSTAAYDVEHDDSTANLQTPVALGGRSVGISTIGGDVGAPSAFPFTNRILLRGITGEDVQLEWEVQKDGAYLQVDTFVLRAYPTRRSGKTFN